MSTDLAPVFHEVARELAGQPGVELADSAKKSFGAGTLKVHGRIFAMVSSAGHFVVKLPRTRVEELVARGDGERFDPGHGRVMKEWLQLARPTPAACLALSREALAFVAAG